MFFLLLALCSSCQDKDTHPSLLQYPVGYPTREASALRQLENYPLPRYLPGNHLLRLFDWMNPAYLASNGQPGVRPEDVASYSYQIQKELITYWNYGIVISNSGTYSGYKDTACPQILQLANAYPNVSLDIITFWTQERPSVLGYNSKVPLIYNHTIDSAYSVTFDRDNKKITEINFNYPDSLIHIDGEVQKFYISKILKFLKRPINRINENGEEPPDIFLIPYIKNDPAIIRMKDSMKIDSWEDFAATRKLQMRNVFSNSFLKELPELQNTMFSFYIVEGGPVDRFKWPILKKCMTQVIGDYYSTPDFYPRWPHNWNDWEGAWHGWKWIEEGRETEIKDGDYLFSPFIAAGWSNKNEDNITPGQWLGLLKCLSVVGAEYYYVGYFNLRPPFNNPSDYVWQAAMPAYAQAITSRFEDILKDGNVLFDENKQPIISYPTDDKHVLISVRKKNNVERYVICGTYQPFSNDSDEIPEKRNVNVTVNGHNLSFEIRRQGSVYIYEKTTDNRSIFYQLDKWHENKHPERWSKDFYFEAEVADSGISSSDIFTTTTGNEGDYTNFVSYIHLKKNKESLYHFGDRDSVNQNHYLWVLYKGNGVLNIKLENDNHDNVIEKREMPETTDWKWLKILLPDSYNFQGNNAIIVSALEGTIDVDKFVITTNGDAAFLY
jgi:hypothetical protein